MKNKEINNLLERLVGNRFSNLKEVNKRLDTNQIRANAKAGKKRIEAKRKKDSDKKRKQWKTQTQNKQEYQKRKNKNISKKVKKRKKPFKKGLQKLGFF